MVWEWSHVFLMLWEKRYENWFIKAIVPKWLYSTDIMKRIVLNLNFENKIIREQNNSVLYLKIYSMLIRTSDHLLFWMREFCCWTKRHVCGWEYASCLWVYTQYDLPQGEIGTRFLQADHPGWFEVSPCMQVFMKRHLIIVKVRVLPLVDSSDDPPWHHLHRHSPQIS